jgi:hypothetical protein
MLSLRIDGSAIVMALPMPEFAPVTSAFWPSKTFGIAREGVFEASDVGADEADMIFPLEPKLDARIRSYALSCRAKAAGRIDAREDQIRPTRPPALQASSIAR